MVSFQVSVLHGMALCIPFSVFVMVSFWRRPRLWLHSLPKDISTRVPPKTELEEKQTRWLKLVFIFILPGLSVVSVFVAARSAGIDLSFVGVALHLYIVWIVVHLWDLLVIDGLHVLLINPNNPPIPGTENAEGWHDFYFHFQSFVKASVTSALFVLPAGALLSFFV